MNNNVENIAIICGYMFPEGMAPTTRILSYCKGLNLNNISTDIYIYRPTIRDKIQHLNKNIRLTGEVEKARYIYSHSIEWSKYSIFRWIYDRPLSYLKTAINIYRQNKKIKYDYVVLSFDGLFFLLFFISFSRLIKSKPIFIADEYPKPIREKLKLKIPYLKKVAYSLVFIGLDSMVLMTNNLSDYFNRIRRKPTYILSNITDTSRFINYVQYNFDISSRIVLCYMGNLELAKDNVDNIIKAFSLVLKHKPNVELHLYGLPSEKDRKLLDTMIKEFNISNKVFFMGRINYENVPETLATAHILVSSQPKTLRAQGGFPTKLGEYLSTGVPVILTNVGEISNYVQDGIHLWMVEPENPEDYAAKIFYVLDNYNFAKKIALNSVQFVKEKFDVSYVGRCFVNFLNNH